MVGWKFNRWFLSCVIEDMLEAEKSAYLPKEVVDLEARYATVGIAIEAGESCEGLEIRVTSEVLSLSLNKDLLLSSSLEKLFKLVLGLNSNHFNLF